MPRFLLFPLLPLLALPCVSTAFGQACPPATPQAAQAIEEFRRSPPRDIALGALEVSAIEPVQRLVALGQSAVEPLLAASVGNDKVTALYSVLALGRIFAGVERRAPSDCRTVVVGRLRELKERYRGRDEDVYDTSIRGVIDEALQDLGESETVTVAGPLCCATDAELVTTGPLKGGKGASDYFPGAHQRAQAGQIDPRWGEDKTAGKFDINAPIDKGRRAGALVQFIGTCEGDRSLCKITQFVTVPINTRPGGEQYTTPKDDIKKSGADASKAPFRQDIGTDQISIADPVSAYYTPAGDDSKFHIQKKYTSCVESTSTECKFDRCCVEWSFEIKIEGGAVVANFPEVKATRKFCEKAL